MTLLHLISVTLVLIALAQTNDVSTAIDKFALKLLAESCNSSPSTENIALSPYTIWAAMSMVNEGAHGNTAKQLEDTLGIPSNNKENFSTLQKEVLQNLQHNHEGAYLETFNAMFTRSEAKLESNYTQVVRNVYNAEIIPVDFKNVAGAVELINKKLSDATKGHINSIVTEDSIENSHALVTSALYFKGQWDKQFNKSRTKDEPFYNERHEVIANVSMMYNSGLFPYTMALDKQAVAVELPYISDKMSMIVIMPRKHATLCSILRKISATNVQSLVELLQKAKETYALDNVDVILPKFTISSDIKLKELLGRLGIRDAFESSLADLSGISNVKLFLSNVLHKTKIEVDEEGTTGSSITVTEIQYVSTPPEFKANRPFAFMIYDKQTKSIVLMGKVGKPSKVLN